MKTPGKLQELSLFSARISATVLSLLDEYAREYFDTDERSEDLVNRLEQGIHAAAAEFLEEIDN